VVFGIALSLAFGGGLCLLWENSVSRDQIEDQWRLSHYEAENRARFKYDLCLSHELLNDKAYIRLPINRVHAVPANILPLSHYLSHRERYRSSRL
jgi:hypothetical protein